MQERVGWWEERQKERENYSKLKGKKSWESQCCLCRVVIACIRNENARS